MDNWLKADIRRHFCIFRLPSILDDSQGIRLDHAGKSTDWHVKIYENVLAEELSQRRALGSTSQGVPSKSVAEAAEAAETAESRAQPLLQDLAFLSPEKRDAETLSGQRLQAPASASGASASGRTLSSTLAASRETGDMPLTFRGLRLYAKEGHCQSAIGQDFPFIGGANEMKRALNNAETKPKGSCTSSGQGRFRFLRRLRGTGTWRRCRRRPGKAQLLATRRGLSGLGPGPVTRVCSSNGKSTETSGRAHQPERSDLLASTVGLDCLDAGKFWTLLLPPGREATAATAFRLWDVAASLVLLACGWSILTLTLFDVSQAPQSSQG